MPKFIKSIKKIITSIICILLIFIIITSLIIMFRKAMNPDKVPSLFGYKVMVVLTGSMSPKIKPGDLVISKSISLNSVNIGTIITYMTKDKLLITHRVVEIQDENGVEMYKTKGDANPVADVDLVSQDQLQGMYFTKIPYVGWISSFAKTRTGIIVLISIFILIIIGGEFKTYIMNSIKQKRSSNSKDKEIET